MTAPPANRDRNAAADDREPLGADLLAGFQRWLIRSGARSMRRELTGQVRRTISGNSPAKADVWDTATTEPPPETHEAPECAWCPICQAARRIRESGPGLSGQLAGVGDAVATAVQEALSAFDSVLSTRPRTEGSRPSRPGGTSTTGAPGATSTTGAPGATSTTGAPGATSSTDAAAGADHEPDDRG
jgi:hypothetical protein